MLSESVLRVDSPLLKILLVNLNEMQRKAFIEQIGNRWVKRDYSGSRNLEQALASYKLGLLCAQAIQEKDRVVAGLLHHIAWLYRYMEDHTQEHRFLEFSLEAYVKVFEREGTGGNEAKLLYLLGELNRRVGRFHEAVQWFGRVIHDKRITDAAMIRASREQWALLREQMISGKMELPQEMLEADKEGCAALSKLIAGAFIEQDDWTTDNRYRCQ